MTNIEPCQTCGAPVRMRKQRLPKSNDETRGEVVDVRVCTSRTCPTNGRERSLGDIV